MKTTNAELVLEQPALRADMALTFIERLAVVRSHSAARITWHSHYCYEILLLADGATAYEFQPNDVAELAGGHFLVVPPNRIHRGLNDVRKPALLCGLMVSAGHSPAGCISPFSDTDLVWIGQQLANASLQPRKMSLELQTHVKRLPRLISEFNPCSRSSVIRTRIKICELLFEIASQLDSVIASRTADVAEEAIRQMQQSLDRPISIRDLVNQVGCSRAKLFEAFKESTGLTPNDYFQRMRIEQAHHAVVNSKDSMTKIAADYGFSSSQYFCTVFRKYFGASPRECRNGKTGKAKSLV